VRTAIESRAVHSEPDMEGDVRGAKSGLWADKKRAERSALCPIKANLGKRVSKSNIYQVKLFVDSPP
jgi:hypothetical protein